MGGSERTVSLQFSAEETMTTGSSRIFCSIALAFLAGCTATASATERSGAGNDAQVTILYDAFGKDSGM